MDYKEHDAADEINIVFATDSEYVVQTYIAVYSMLINHKDIRKLIISILISNTFKEEKKQLFNNIDRLFNCTLVFINVGEAFKTVRINNNHIKTSTMYRLLIPKVLTDVGKCIYLDSDLVVEGEIAELYDINVDGICIAGVRAYGDRYYFTDEWKSILHIPSPNQYINAGVLLMNLNEIRNRNLEEKLIIAGNNAEFLYNDQDAINVVFYNSIQFLPAKYNARWKWIFPRDKRIYQFFGRENIIDARKNAVIFHYAGVNKPWNSKFTHEKRRWWKYIKRQDQIVADYIDSFLKNTKQIKDITTKDKIQFYTEIFRKRFNITLIVIDWMKRILHSTHDIVVYCKFQIKRIVFREKNYYCPCCGLRFNRFVTGNYLEKPEVVDINRYKKTKQDVLCPYCYSLPRHRILALWIQEHKELISSPNILYIAPDPSELHLIKRNHISCTTADLYRKTDINIDIENTGLPDSSYDLIICNHVLEHVDSYQNALSEIYRILRPGGSLICSFPMDRNIEIVDEDKRVCTQEEKIRRFGLRSHNRIFGMKADRIFTEVGFDVEKIKGEDFPEDILPIVGPADYDMNILFHCKKK